MAETKTVIGIFDFEDHYKGDTLEPYKFWLKDTDTNEQVSLVGCTAKIQLRRNETSKVLFTFKQGANISKTVAPLLIEDNKIVIPQIKEFDINAGIYVYDIQLVFPTGEKLSFLKGKLTVIHDVTV